jgi:hypothetical protein
VIRSPKKSATIQTSHGTSNNAATGNNIVATLEFLFAKLDERDAKQEEANERWEALRLAAI